MLNNNYVMEMLFFYSLGIKYNFPWKNKTFTLKYCFAVRAGFDFQLTPMQVKVAVGLPKVSSPNSQDICIRHEQT
jgi:hypothetical protein